MSHQWFKVPDLVGGWKTAQENQSNNMLESSVGTSGGLPGDFSLADFSSVDFWVGSPPGIAFIFDTESEDGWLTHPIDYQVNDPHQQYYPVGLMPLGLDITPRALIGVNPYAQRIPIFTLDDSILGGPDVLG